MANLDEHIGFRANKKTKFFSDNAEVSARDIHILGLKQYYKDNPTLKHVVKANYIKERLQELEKNNLDSNLETEALEKELFDIMLKTKNLGNLLQDDSIVDKEEFLNSVFAIKQIIGDDGSFDEVANSDFGIQSLCCNMNTDVFKEKCKCVLEMLG